jgi:hypothetical protein
MNRNRLARAVLASGATLLAASACRAQGGDPVTDLFFERPAVAAPGKKGQTGTAPDGNVWSCRVSDGTVRRVEFLTDGWARFFEKDAVTWACRWSREGSVVTAGGSVWTPAPDKAWILQKRCHRVWYRGAEPPPPDTGLAAVLAGDGVSWELDGGDSAYKFQAGGAFTEEGVRDTPKGTWRPWYGRTVCLTYGSGRTSLLNVSADGAAVLREDGNLYRRREAKKGAGKEAGKEAVPAASAAVPPVPLPVAAPTLRPRNRN